jgi:hypothetical protein
MNLTHEHPQTQSSKRTTDKERRQRIPSIPYSIVKEQTNQRNRKNQPIVGRRFLGAEPKPVKR